MTPGNFNVLRQFKIPVRKMFFTELSVQTTESSLFSDPNDLGIRSYGCVPPESLVCRRDDRVSRLLRTRFSGPIFKVT